MKKLSLVLIVLVILVVGLGFYRGWFTVSSQSQDTENKTDINLTVDRGKVKEDVREVKDKTTELAKKGTAEAKELGNRAKEKVKLK